MKICTKCNENKTLDDFAACSGRKDRKQVWCRACSSFFRKNRGHNEYSKRSEYFKEWQRKYRTTEKAKTLDRKYRTKYHQTFSGLVSKLLAGAKARAKVFEREFDLDSEWTVNHLEGLVCEATGMPLSLDISKGHQHTYNRPSIDRIDNDKGYTKDNCQIVSVIYNKAKSDGNHEHVMEMCECLMKRNN